MLGGVCKKLLCLRAVAHSHVLMSSACKNKNPKKIKNQKSRNPNPRSRHRRHPQRGRRCSNPLPPSSSWSAHRDPRERGRGHRVRRSCRHRRSSSLSSPRERFSWIYHRHGVSHPPPSNLPPLARLPPDPPLLRPTDGGSTREAERLTQSTSPPLLNFTAAAAPPPPPL